MKVGDLDLQGFHARIIQPAIVELSNTLLRPQMIEEWARAVFHGRWRVEFSERPGGLAMRVRVGRKRRTVAILPLDLALPITEFTRLYLRPIADELQLTVQ